MHQVSGGVGHGMIGSGSNWHGMSRPLPGTLRCQGAGTNNNGRSSMGGKVEGNRVVARCDNR